MRCPTCAHVAALLASLLLTACATPPDLQQTLRQNGTASPQLQRGPRMLSPAQSTAILERLRQEQRNDILDRHLAFESALLDKPIVTGNRLKLLQDGPATYQAMFTAIERYVYRPAVTAICTTLSSPSTATARAYVASLTRLF